MKEKKIIKLTVLTFILMLVIGLAIYISKESSGENIASDGQELPLKIGSTNVENSQTKNAQESFYYKEMNSEKVFEGSPGKKLFYRYKNQWVKAVLKEQMVAFEGLDSGAFLFEVPWSMFSSSGFDLSSDGFLWTASVNSSEQTLEIKKHDIEANLLETITLNDLGAFFVEEEVYLKGLQVQADHIYLLGETESNPQLQVYDMAGDLKYTHASVDCFDVNVNGDFVVQKGDSEGFNFQGYFGYRIADGTEFMRNEKFMPLLIKYNLDYSKLLLVGESVLLADPHTGKILRPLLEFGVDTSYLLDDLVVSDLILTEESAMNILVSKSLYEDSKFFFDNILFTYDKIEGLKPTKETTVTITVPYRSDYISEAIKRYEMLYPEERVAYDYAYNSFEAFLDNREEYGQKLALKIISNEVGDIVQTGGSALRYWPLAQTDVFMDLEPLLKADPIYKDLNTSVLEGVRVNGKIRTLPITFNFYQYELNTDLAQKIGLGEIDEIRWSDALSYIEKLEKLGGGSKWRNESPGRLSVLEDTLESMLIANMPDLIDLEKKTVNLNQEWFKDLMKTYKSVYNSDAISEDKVAYDSADRLQGGLLRDWTPLNRVGDDLAYYGIYNESQASKFIPNISGEKNPNRIAYSRYMYAINERSENKESAWKFLKFLVGEDMQLQITREGTPVNVKAMEGLLNKAVVNRRKSLDQMTPVDKAFVEAYRKNSQKVDVLFDMDYMKVDLSDQIKRYFKGEISLEEALENAEKSIKIRLNE